jgi:hypothetical protein
MQLKWLKITQRSHAFHPEPPQLLILPILFLYTVSLLLILLIRLFLSFTLDFLPLKKLIYSGTITWGGGGHAVA